MPDAGFAAFVAACRNELRARQQRFAERLANGGRWHYDLDTLQLRLDELTVRIVPIGTFCPSRGTWLWAWANESFPATAREAARAVQELHRITGFRVFADDGTYAATNDVDDLLAMTVHVLAADAYFRVPGDESTLFLAVHLPRSGS